MTPERLAEIRQSAEPYKGTGLVRRRPGSGIAHRGELLAYVDELEAERDAFGAKAQFFQEQRDGALATIRAHAEPLRRLAGMRLAANPVDDEWGVVQYYALHLLRFAGPPPRALSPTPDDPKDPE